MDSQQYMLKVISLNSLGLWSNEVKHRSRSSGYGVGERHMGGTQDTCMRTVALLASRALEQSANSRFPDPRSDESILRHGSREMCTRIVLALVLCKT